MYKKTNEEFYAGAYKTDITPQLGTKLFGYPSIRIATSVHDRLEAKAVALKNAEELVLIISMEILSIRHAITEKLKKQITDETGVKHENILIFSIHTHSAPVTETVAGWGSEDTEYLDNILLPQIVCAAKGAIDAMKPAKMGFSVVNSETGINRRQVLPDGRITLGQNPDKSYDPKMTVVSFVDLSGKAIANLFHYGAHPTAAGANTEITRDWPGHPIDRLTEISGGITMFLNGAAGDVGPRISNGKTIGDLSYAKEAGVRAASDAERAYRNIKEYKTPHLAVISKVIHLPYAPLPTETEVQRELERLGDPDKLTETNILLYDRLQRILNVYKSGVQPETEWETQQTDIALDDIAIVPYKFELFCDISLNQQASSPFAHTLCIGYACGLICYLPTEEEIPYGGYEVDSFRAMGTYTLKNNTDKTIVEENLKILNELHTL